MSRIALCITQSLGTLLDDAVQHCGGGDPNGQAAMRPAQTGNQVLK
jgi:hypothetical protein